MKKSFFNQLLNISEAEWPRIMVAWLINFFFRIGFVIGWTVLISMFVSRIGIQELPILFILNAVLVIVGSMIYSELIRRVNKEVIMVLTTLVAGVALYLTSFFAYHSNFIFFALILVAIAIFITQLKLIIEMFTEDLFTPLEGQRTLPIIESSETIGGILGGLIIMLLAAHIPSYKFLYIWVICLGLIIPIIFLFRKFTQKLPALRVHKNGFVKTSHLEKIREGFNQVRKVPFLKGLLIVVLCQWIFINLMEFQYTKAIHQSVTHQPEITIVYEDSSQNTPPLAQNLKASVIDLSSDTKPTSPPTINPVTQAVTRIPNYERSLTFNLGTLFILFSSASLVIQLFTASRIISLLGTIGSLLLFPFVMLLSMLGFTLKFNFMTAIITRTSYEITNAVYRNAYHTSYYALEQEIREQAREFMEGLIKPLGAIIGMVILMGMQSFVIQEKLTLSINGLMLLVLLIMMLILLRLRNKYTLVSKKILKGFGDHHAKHNAVEILSQKGHKHVTSVLIKNLTNPAESEKLKIKILEALGKIKNPHTISEIIDCFTHPSEKIRLAAVEALTCFENMGKHFFAHAFSQYRVIKNLKTLFKRETSEEIRSAIIKTLAHFNETEVVSFLIKTLKNNPNPHVKADCIYVCGLFHDPNAGHYIEPYLKSKNNKIRANAMIALWQFRKYRAQILEELKREFLASKSKHRLGTALYILGEIKEKSLTEHLFKHVKSPDDNLKKHAALSLGKIGHEKAILPLAKMICETDAKTAAAIQKALKNIHPQIREKINNLIHQSASEKINAIFNEHPVKTLEELEQKTLQELKEIYELVDAEEEVRKIEHLLKTTHS